MDRVGVKCFKCGMWYTVEARCETRMDDMTTVAMRWDDKRKVHYEEEVTAKFPRVMLGRFEQHDCKSDKKRDGYGHD